MRPKLGHPLDCNCLGRRNFLKLTAGAMAGLTGGGLFLADQARADALSKELRDKLTPEQIISSNEEREQAFSCGRKERTQLPSRTESKCEGTIPSGRLANMHRLARTG